jgi:hypothetical protein
LRPPPRHLVIFVEWFNDRRESFRTWWMPSTAAISGEQRIAQVDARIDVFEAKLELHA